MPRLTSRVQVPSPAPKVLHRPIERAASPQSRRVSHFVPRSPRRPPACSVAVASQARAFGGALAHLHPKEQGGRVSAPSPLVTWSATGPALKRDVPSQERPGDDVLWGRWRALREAVEPRRGGVEPTRDARRASWDGGSSSRGFRERFAESRRRSRRWGVEARGGGGFYERAAAGTWGDQCQAPAAWTGWPVRSCSSRSALDRGTHPVHDAHCEPCLHRTYCADAGGSNWAASRCAPHATQWMCWSCAAGPGRPGLRAFRSRFVSCFSRFISPGE